MNRGHSIISSLCAGALLCSPAIAPAQPTAAPPQQGGTITLKELEDLAKRGDAEAQFVLAEAYKWGNGVKIDLKKAELLYGKAAAQGHMQASDEYGLLLFDRGEHETAFPYVQAASNRGDARAQYLIAIAHFNGKDLPKDWVRAYALMSLAQVAGLPQAAVALQKFDGYIPLAQRQQGVALSQQLSAEAEATRNRQMTAADLGNPVAPPARVAPPPPPVVAPPPQVVLRNPAPAPSGAIAAAQQTANGANPRMAGADYARPAMVAPPPPTPKPAPTLAIAPKPVPAPKPVAAPPPAPKPAPAVASTSGTWRIQFGAFGVSANADALWAKLKARPEVAGHARVNVSVGAVTKLQAGGYSEEAAKGACGKLTSAGFTCVPVKN